MAIESFPNLPNNLDIVNIGSGISDQNFDWSILPEVRGFNFAIRPEDFRYDARIIKNYGNHVKKGGIVIVVVCPLSFGKNEYLYKNYFNEKYIRILPFEDVDVSLFRYVLFKKIPFIYSFHLFTRKCLYYIKVKIYRLIKKNKMTICLNPVDNTIKGWIHDSPGLSNLTDPSQSKLFEKVFEEKKADLHTVINNCVEKELIPVLLVPPICNELYNKMSSEFLKSFMYDNLKDEINRGIPILDYSRNIDFTDDSFFVNGLFLNENKKKMFTKDVYIRTKQLLDNKSGK